MRWYSWVRIPSRELYLLPNCTLGDGKNENFVTNFVKYPEMNFVKYPEMIQQLVTVGLLLAISGHRQPSSCPLLYAYSTILDH